MRNADKGPRLLRRALLAMPLAPRHARLRKSSDGTARLLRLQAEIASKDEGRVAALAIRALDALCWPFVAASRLRDISEQIVGLAAGERALSVRRFRLAALWDCVRLGISPHDYFNFALYQPHAAGTVGDYVFAHEWRRIYSAFHGLARPEDLYVVDHKRAFLNLARANGLATPCLLAMATKGEVEFHEPVGGEAWNCDIIMKPELGSNGSGFYRWVHEAEDRYRGALGETVTTAKILREVERLSASGPVVVQQRLRNDPQTERWTGGGLATVRVVTGKRAGGRAQVIGAAMKMPVGSALVDNYMRGNVLAQIDCATGRMMSGASYFHHLRPIDRHPDTGEMFRGQRVPGWDEIASLAERAHELMPSLVVVAFDIAPTASGPVIVESNSKGDLAMIQYPPARPIGQTDYPAIALSHLDRGHRSQASHPIHAGAAHVGA